MKQMKSISLGHSRIAIKEVKNPEQKVCKLVIVSFVQKK